MTDQEKKLNSLETFVHNANSYALSLERRVND